MNERKRRKLFIVGFLIAIALGFALAFWLFYQPQEFIYRFF